MTTQPAETSAGDRSLGLLRLYIAGQSPKSLDAFVNLKAICEERLPGQYEIEIVDLVEQPELAVADDVLALPMLLRVTPPPSRRIIGDLSDTERVLGQLKITKAVAW